MKTVYIMSGVLLAVAAVGYVVINFVSDSGVSSVEEISEQPARIQPLSADVSVAASREDSYLVIDTEQEIMTGSRIKTSPEGRALITSEEKILTSVAAGSELTFAYEGNPSTTRIEIVAGKMWSRIERTLEQDEQYEVYTPTMVTAVRGTSFGIAVGAIEKITVTEGVVRVQARNTETGEPDPEREWFVDAGEVIEVRAGEFIVRPLTDSDKDEWFYEHNAKTEAPEIQKVAPAPTPQLKPQTPVDLGTSTPETPLHTLAITSVTPAELVDPDDTTVILRGEGFLDVDEVYLSGIPIAFVVDSDTTIRFSASEIPGNDVYDITLESATETYTFEEGLEVAIEEEEEKESGVPFFIDALEEEFESSTESAHVVVHGGGFDLVEGLLVNGQQASFEIMSSAETVLFDVQLSAIRTIEMNGQNQTLIYER